MSNVINLNADRKHEVIKYLTMGFGFGEVASMFEMPVATVKRFYEEYLDKNPTPPTVA